MVESCSDTKKTKKYKKSKKVKYTRKISEVISHLTFRAPVRTSHAAAII